VEIADVHLAAKKVDEFVRLLRADESHWSDEEVVPIEPPEHWAMRDRETEIQRRLGLVVQIAERVDPALLPLLRAESPGWRWQQTLKAAQELAGHLTSLEEAEQILGPVGPRLAAARLHPWVWNVAVSLWDNGHRREAVRAAASAIFDLHLPAKLGVSRSASAKDLAAQAFATDEPASGKSRLRLPDYPKGSPDWICQHQGAMHLGIGCAQLIRNLIIHGAEPDEQTALEQLATLSLFAQLVDKAKRTPIVGHA
jgi:hypothetical protein